MTGALEPGCEDQHGPVKASASYGIATSQGGAAARELEQIIESVDQ